MTNDGIIYNISIHALREEGDPQRNFLEFEFDKISIHALREEGDARSGEEFHRLPRFLSTPSARRATFFGSWPQFWRRYFYPRPPRGGRPAETV